MVSHIFKKTALSLVALLAFSACASLPASDAPQSENGVLTDRLAPRELAPNECGIFIWTADTARRFILFSQIESDHASWWTDKGEVQIMRTSSEGYSAYSQPPNQAFSMPDGGTLQFELEDAEEITSGTRYKSGSIRLAGEDGWETVMPVIGLAGCQRAQS